MSMDELMRAFQGFSTAAKEYGVSQGIKDATDAVAQLKQQSDLDYNQRTQMQNQIANQLQGGLAGLGAPASQIAQAVGSIQAPQIKSSADALSLAQSSTDPMEREQLLKQAKQFSQLEGEQSLELQRPLIDYKNKLDTAREAKTADRQLALSKLKSEISLDKDQVTKMGQLGSQYEEKSAPLRASLQQADRAFALLNSNNPVADTASLNALVKASGDTGVITESDRQAFGGSKAFDSQLTRVSSQLSSGKLDPESRKFLTSVADLYRTKANDSLTKTADRFADRAVNLLGVDKAKALSVIDPDVARARMQPAAPAAPTTKFTAEQLAAAQRSLTPEQIQKLRQIKASKATAK